ncbi:zinc ion binding [Striga asiatica]|uniref:Zinc ion binding n=1 Tax=Striga asiatica TaxID=4170 RepID=A0A5A7QST0_STRAF|nr:zinc ion binding [Striga asiatica]
MDPIDIARLVEEMKKAKVAEKDKVVIESEVINREVDRMSRCLLVKVFSSKPINREVFKQQMPMILNLSKGVDIESVGENLFIMEFRSLQDRRRTLTEGPWNLFQNLVLFKEIRGLQNPREVFFDSISIWVQLHNLPIALMNKRAIQSIASKTGDVIEIDEGHVLKECESPEGDRENLPFGPWLKAATHLTGKKNRNEGRASPRSSPTGSSSSNHSPGQSRDFFNKDFQSPAKELHSPIGIDSEKRYKSIRENSILSEEASGGRSVKNLTFLRTATKEMETYR